MDSPWEKVEVFEALNSSKWTIWILKGKKEDEKIAELFKLVSVLRPHLGTCTFSLVFVEISTRGIFGNHNSSRQVQDLLKYYEAYA